MKLINIGTGFIQGGGEVMVMVSAYSGVSLVIKTVSKTFSIWHGGPHMATKTNYVQNSISAYWHCICSVDILKLSLTNYFF